MPIGEVKLISCNKERNFSMEKKRKSKKCKECTKEFFPFSSLEKFCSVKCSKWNAKSKRKVKREQKKLSVSVLSKKLDTVFGHYIRRRDAIHYGVCVTCNEQYDFLTLQCGHFMSRSSRATRWDEQNCSGQCSVCNLFKQWRQFEHGRALNDRWWDGTAVKMLTKSKETLKVTREWLLERIEFFNGKLKYLNNSD